MTKFGSSPNRSFNNGSGVSIKVKSSPITNHKINDQSRFKVGFAGSGHYSVLCAEALHNHPNFELAWVITPPAKPAGRRQELKPPALLSWAKQNKIAVLTVPATKAAAGKKPIDQLQTKIKNQAPIDFLVVVSFGYLVPPWLLKLPQIAPVNIHPSDLPQYQGSSPGQFSILYGNAESAVSFIKMNNKFDQGEIITKLPLTLNKLETQTSYYDKAFNLASQHLPQILKEYADNQKLTPQQQISLSNQNLPLILAKKLSKTDGFLPYQLVKLAQSGKKEIDWSKFKLDSDKTSDSEQSHISLNRLGSVLTTLLNHQPNLLPSQLADRTCRAFTPWPGIWTILPKYKNRSQVRVKILQASLQTNQQTRAPYWQIESIQADGELPKKVNII